ncbi:MAG TPA: photosynthetic reaction center subunit H, partial [Bradyrhizobium sp.]
MQEGAYLDVAQVTLYVFWIFFACLIFYLRREDKREGYPLDSTASGGGVVHGFPKMPDPKTYLLRDGHVATLPNHKNDRRDVAVAPIAVWPGAPMEPTGNPMLDGVGPGSWADREDVPELNIDNVPCIVPLRLAEGTYLEPRDPDPRGMRVIGADNEIGGVVTDVWVDRAEALI